MPKLKYVDRIKSCDLDHQPTRSQIHQPLQYSTACERKRMKERENKQTMSQQAPSLSGRTPQFTFVSGNIQSEARSHAMREHWKQRHKRNELAKSNHGRRTSRNLLPRSSSSEGFSSTKSRQRLAGVDEEKEKDADNVGSGIPAQILCGIGYALSTSRPDPFQTCPIFLTSQHQRLLHHCT